jgi:hypothetical protein
MQVCKSVAVDKTGGSAKGGVMKFRDVMIADLRSKLVRVGLSASEEIRRHPALDDSCLVKRREIDW